MQVSVSFIGSAEVAHDGASQPDLAELDQLSSRTMTCTADVVDAADAFCATQATAKSLVEVRVTQRWDKDSLGTLEMCEMEQFRTSAASLKTHC